MPLSLTDARRSPLLTHEEREYDQNYPSMQMGCVERQAFDSRQDGHGRCEDAVA
jgi:hypothetical protein